MRYLLVSLSFVALIAFCFCFEAGAQQYSGFGWQPAQQNSFNGGYAGLNTNTQQYNQAPQRNQQHNNASGLEQKLQAVENSNSVGWYQAPAPPPAQMRAPVQASPNNRSGMFPGISKKEAMRIFFEGGTPNMGGGGSFGNTSAPSGPASNPGANSNAYSNYQTARNEETKARNYSNTARYNKDKWGRKNAASQAEYAANNANYAAQRAQSAAYNGDSQARSYASLARDAANRAREHANRARYNADTIN